MPAREYRQTETKLYHRAALILAAVIIVVVLTPCIAHAGCEGDIELLQAVAAAYRTNCDAIKTWQGQASISSVKDIRDSEHQELVHTVSFAYSQRQNASRWEMRTIESRYTLDGRETPAPDAGCYYGMLKGDRYYKHFMRESDPEHTCRTLKVYRRRTALVEMLTSGFDPMYFLTDGSEPHDRRLMFLYDNAQNPKMSGHYVITRNGTQVQVEESSPPAQNVTRYTYDLAKSGNLIEELSEFPSGSIRFGYVYEQTDGIWLPKSVIYESTSRRPGATESAEALVTTSKKRFEWTATILNKALPPDAFSLAKLGIQPGDEIVDYAREIRFVYTSDEGIENPQGAAPVSRPRQSRPVRFTR